MITIEFEEVELSDAYNDIYDSYKKTKDLVDEMTKKHGRSGPIAEQFYNMALTEVPTRISVLKKINRARGFNDISFDLPEILK